MTSAVRERGGAGYVHGYSDNEAERLADQAATLADLLHADTAYPAGSRVLEAGCGVGAQTVRLLASSPGARFVCVDQSADSLDTARRRVGERDGVEWHRADVRELPFLDGEFDHIFVCFVLEHLNDPVGGLRELRRVLRPGGTLTVIEGDHGSAFYHPTNPYTQAAIDCLVRLQAADGGNALIGRELWPLLADAGYADIHVTPRTVHTDHSRPTLVRGFVRDTFTAMVAGVRERAVAEGLMTEDDWACALTGLDATAAPDGTFHYTFCKAVAVRPPL